MTKIEHARQLLTKNPKISPADMSAEMDLPLKTVYLLRSQAKASLKKAKKKTQTAQQIVNEHNLKVAGIQGWDDEPVEGPANWKNIRVEASPSLIDKLEQYRKEPKKDESLNALLAKMDRLREELADARAVIRYLEKRLEGKCS